MRTWGKFKDAGVIHSKCIIITVLCIVFGRAGEGCNHMLQVCRCRFLKFKHIETMLKTPILC
jgi:hypothetical protein